MSTFISDILKGLGVKESESKQRYLADKLHEYSRNEKIKIICFHLEAIQSKDKNGFTLTKTEVAEALGGIGENQMTSMIKDGRSPRFFKISKARKSPYRFPIIGVAEFLLDHADKYQGVLAEYPLDAI